MIRDFLIALQFLTRIPVPRSIDAPGEDLGRAAGFFPLVGALVGGGGASVYAALGSFLPDSTCVLAILIYAALITGGLHEDGLADSFDGFGGGWTREDALRIMRDSRIGTFGAVGLILLVLTKYNLLSMIERGQLWRWLIIAHTASRWTTLPLCLWLPSAREQGQGKLVARRIGSREIVIGTLTLLAVLLLVSWKAALAVFVAIASIVLLSGHFYRRRLQGITGDCLGATNQLTEVAVYATAIISSRL